ncbi:MAG: hypothetical protein L0323_14255 [Planctomycetes bacterium]|nr:hypothetical protein [Planctomycetota bacterium]
MKGRCLPVGLVLAVSAPSGRGQTLLETLSAYSPLHLGNVVEGLGDTNGDGVPDVALGDWPFDGSPMGQVLIQSGATGSTLFVLTGDSPGSWFGTAVAGAGDVDGDGQEDLLVGIPKSDLAGQDSGSVRLFSGQNGALLNAWNGEAAGDEFGGSVSGGWDADGDGVPDCLVGSPRSDGGGIDSGRVALYSGATGTLLAAWVGGAPDDWFGQSAAMIGDCDGDGLVDVAVGAYGVDGGGAYAGQVTLFSAGTGAAIHSWIGDTDSGLGVPVAAAGDVDADGVPDVAASARWANGHAGQARVFSGKTGATLYTWNGTVPYSYFGGSLDGAGDVNADGFSDVIVGGSSNPARVYSGATGGILLLFPGEGAVSQAGDLNGDGLDDVLVGVPNFGGTPFPVGQVVARSGLLGGVLFFWSGVPGGLFFGTSVAGVGDVDGDGAHDVVVGGPGPPSGSAWPPQSGTARLSSGATGALLLSWNGPSNGGAFGSAVAGCGDASGDGTPDLVVAAPGPTTPNPAVPPMARLFSGADGSTLQSWVGAPTSRFGAAVAGVGDLDGDGRGDVAIGSTYGTSGAGLVEVFSGSTGSLLLALPGGGGSFGASVSAAGDLDADGTPDLVVGAPYAIVGGAYLGQARAFSGASGAILRSWNGNGPAQSFGSSVGGGGDVDADGIPDVVVGAPYPYSSAANGGEATVFSGSTGNMLFALTGWTGGESFGSAVACDGDVNGDGWADILVGAPNAGSPGAYGTGQVRVFAGPSGSLLDVIQGTWPGASLGRSVAYAGLVDAGASSDIVAGAPYSGPTGNGTAYVYNSSAGGAQGYLDLGSSLAGTGGVGPLLHGFGALQAGGSVTLAAHRAAPDAAGILVLGTALSPTPILGGIFLPSVGIPLVGFDASPTGDAVIAFGLPSPTVPPGAQIYAQAAFMDPGAPQGVSFSNAISATFP